MDKEQIAAYNYRTTTIEGIFVSFAVMLIFSGIAATILIGLKLGNEQYKELLELCMIEHTFEKCEEIIND